MVADRLAAALRAAGRPCSRQTGIAVDAAPPPAGTVVLADGPALRAARDWDVVIWLRADPSAATAASVANRAPASSSTCTIRPGR
jgi:hypothetical protein